ncbi:helix-turn-helix domain-containing protein [Methylomonas sp. SURF-1]|uniref:Helix-turn-helix domain-containing protein n=1 Tax=Methylomonas aurea TaxID=2952224 RepID=A0ABT1UPV5_9GAMM|nr:helix-turn-helix domain-containing protein [Methylomonas sp. SURF-1]MCQ8183695.1 helix-turn-helix domain-containing protein [Methylomonas sp. SURF-1]
MAKLQNPNRAKIHRNYTVEEIAMLYAVHKNTVRLWIKDGLPTIDRKRPILIAGADLRRYWQSKRTCRKRKCQLFEMYCVRCKVTQRPAENMADYEPLNSDTGRLIGLCPDCGGIINKFVRFNRLDEIRGYLDITQTKALKHISDSNNPLVNSDFNQ